jgi:hypothetical protein
MATTFGPNGTAPATDASDLNALIKEADQLAPFSGTYTIDISGLISLNTLPAVSDGESLSWSGSTATVVTDTAVPDIAAVNLHTGVSLVINGGAGATLDGGNTVRGLFAYAGNLTVDNVTIQNTVAQGGAGGNAEFAGGGGAGLGGGLFVGANANVTLNSVSFSDDKAVGGAGGDNTGGGQAQGYAGGGGLGGNGALAFGNYVSGGGGVGRTAFGGVGSHKGNPNSSGTDDTGNPGKGIIYGLGGYGGNGAKVPNGVVTSGAKYGGGGGISSGYSYSANGKFYGGGAGGGGVGGKSGYTKYARSTTEKTGGGGAGGFGGGGGAGYYFGGKGGFGGGGGGGKYGYGGNGGFGGGGGGIPNKAHTLGQGGFGGGNAGGGYNIGNYGTASTGVPESKYALGGGASGGGGLGAGGAVFVQSGGVLTLGGTGSLTGDSVTGGAAGVATLDGTVIISKTEVINGHTETGYGTAGTAGSAFGSAIFIQNNSTSVAQGVTFAPASGQALTVSGVIADEKDSGGINANATQGWSTASRRAPAKRSSSSTTRPAIRSAAHSRGCRKAQRSHSMAIISRSVMTAAATIRM